MGRMSECIPKSSEENHHDNRENPDTDGFSLLEDLDQAVQESSEPQKPLEESGQHDTADNGGVDDLGIGISWVTHWCVE